MTTSWVKPEVAIGQLELVSKQWLQLDNMKPYLYFAKAMFDICALQNEVRLLDVGCGVGHYGRFCQNYFPHVYYAGCDLSPTMIEYAKEFAPLGRFSVCDILDAPYAGHNVVLLSTVIEYTEDPQASLRKAISMIDPLSIVILHRVRLTGNRSRKVPEPTYLGYVENHYLWNQTELFAFLSVTLMGLRHIEWYNDNQSTIWGIVRA